MTQENDEGLRAAVMLRVRTEIAALDGVAQISPTLVAFSVHDHYKATADVERHIDWCSIQHLKQLAREALRHFDPKARAQDIAEGQGDMFGELLQDRYPIKVGKDDEPQYRRREEMTRDQLDWSIAQIRRAGQALLRHGDALSAYRDERFGVHA